MPVVDVHTHMLSRDFLALLQEQGGHYKIAKTKAGQETIYNEHLLISQFSPGSRVYPSHFPVRNRLMALLTDASVIVEAGETSGTLHQADHRGRVRRVQR